jgi:glycosyltransferase involved in cell wall biosynthesis
MTSVLLSTLRTVRLRMLASPVLAGARAFAASGWSRAGERADAFDLVFVTPPAQARGWILEAICRELGSRLPHMRVAYRHYGDPLPRAARYFHSHYMYFIGSLRLCSLLKGRHFVFATHLEPDKHRIALPLLGRLLDSSDGVVCMNRALARTLAEHGVAQDKLSVSVGAADARAFCRRERGAEGVVGFSTAYYERKNPDRILDIVRGLPHRRFVMLGQGWDRYPRFGELIALPNFEYLEVPYTEYPAHYARMSVFVSASILEGGPIPLLESMMANVVPVASRTGFAPDVIEHGHNGYLFEVDADAETICGLIEQAYRLDVDVRATVERFDWQSFARRVALAMNIPQPDGNAHSIWLAADEQHS